jgi:hypothetical protein
VAYGTYLLHYLSIDFFRFLAIHHSEPRARIRLLESFLPGRPNLAANRWPKQPIAPRTGIGDEKAISQQLCGVIYT